MPLESVWMIGIPRYLAFSSSWVTPLDPNKTLAATSPAACWSKPPSTGSVGSSPISLATLRRSFASLCMRAARLALSAYRLASPFNCSFLAPVRIPAARLWSAGGWFRLSSTDLPSSTNLLNGAPLMLSAKSTRNLLCCSSRPAPISPKLSASPGSRTCCGRLFPQSSHPFVGISSVAAFISSACFLRPTSFNTFCAPVRATVPPPITVTPAPPAHIAILMLLQTSLSSGLLGSNLPICLAIIFDQNC